MDSLIDLVKFYLTTKEVISFETALDKMASLTSSDNYINIIDYIDSFPNSTELDLSMYINAIASPKFIGLEKIIIKKLDVFEDIDAIHDLEMALKKIKPNN
jgi:hypothetical protein